MSPDHGEPEVSPGQGEPKVSPDHREPEVSPGQDEAKVSARLMQSYELLLLSIKL